MTIDQLPSYMDYAATMPTPVIIFVVSVVAFVILATLALFVMELDATWVTTALIIGATASAIAAMFNINAAEDGLARFRAEAVSAHLDETYGVDVAFGEDGVRPHSLDGGTVREGDSVYKISVATDGTILLVDEGGKEVPRVTR